MAAVLLDANVLIAVLLSGHVHHNAAARWLGATTEAFATCPITQGSLMREVVRGGDGFTTASDLLRSIGRHPRHEFWTDDISYVDVPTTGLLGHKQVTDAYLAHLARSRGSRIATFDRALADVHTDVAELVPTS